MVEVNPKGEVVRSYTFTYGWGIYRVVPIALQTINDYNGTVRTNDFTINLSTLNDLGGSTSIYYRINNGPTRSVATNGQPHITTQGSNNTLEYWSVDSNGIVESPHKILTGIGLVNSGGSPTPTSELTQSNLLQPASGFGTNVIIAVAAIVGIIMAVSYAVLMIRRRK